MSHDKATQFAFDTTKNTQGDYSNANAPRFFNMTGLKLAAQFRKYAQMITYVLADATHRSFQGATREERVIARKQLAQIMATQVAVAGALSLPGLEFVRLGFMITSALGLTGSWDDQEDALRKLAEDTFGKTWGEIMTKGFLYKFGVDITSRMSLSDLWLFGEPNTNEAEATWAYLAKQAVGSAGTLVGDYLQGAALLVAGDWSKAFEKFNPLKTINDTVKAINRAEGTSEFVTNVAGFKTRRQAEEGRAKGQSVRNTARFEQAYKTLSRQYREAESLGERAKLRAKIIAHNKATPSFRFNVPLHQIDKHRHDKKPVY
jgi:hypothetical protein